MRPLSPFAFALAFVACAALPACGSLTTAAAPTASACGQLARTGKARHDLQSLVRSCGPLLATTPIEERPAEKLPQRFVFEAAEGAKCYRVFAAGDAGVVSLGVRVRDQDGRNLVESLGPRAFAVLPERALLCLPDAGFYYVDVAVLAGEGGYAVQVLETQ